jgi:hypothetical protein
VTTPRDGRERGREGSESTNSCAFVLSKLLERVRAVIGRFRSLYWRESPGEFRHGMTHSTVEITIITSREELL